MKRVLFGLLAVLWAGVAWAAPTNLTWTNGVGSPADTFSLERRPEASSACNATVPFVEIAATIPGTATAYSDATTTEGAWYSYQLRGKNSKGFGSYSNVVCGQAVSVPGKPTLNITMAPDPPPVILPTLTSWVDPTQCAMTEGQTSHYKEPTHCWMEMIPAEKLVKGLGFVHTGINFPRPNNGAVNFQLMKEAGFSGLRLEVPWRKLDPATDKLPPSEEARYIGIFQMAKAQGLRVLLQLNTHPGTPTPMTEFTRQTTATAAAGARTLVFNDVTGFVAGRTGISHLTGYWVAEILFTAVDAGTKTVTLSKPLPYALGIGGQTLGTLKYRPFSNVGTQDFEATMAGWLIYTRYLTTLMRTAGLVQFDMEILNEMTFGTEFLYINKYYNPALVSVEPNQGRNGLPTPGALWELTRRTVDVLRLEFPEATSIAGLTNTDPFNPRPPGLPSGTMATSYHPYDLQYKNCPADERQPYPSRNVEGWCPASPPYLIESGDMKFFSAVIPELLTVLTKPGARPMAPGVTSFKYLMTEHGWSPSWMGNGVTDVAVGWRQKSLAVLRSFLHWESKGIDAIWYYVDIADGPNAKPLEFDLAPSGILTTATWPADPTPLWTPTLRATQRMMQSVAGAVPIPSPRPVTVSVHREGTGTIFPGDASHPAKTHQQALQVLPFQVTANRFMVATYVQGRNYRDTIPAERTTLALAGINGVGATATASDPISGLTVLVEVLERTAARLVVRMPVADSPILLVIQEA